MYREVHISEGYKFPVKPGYVAVTVTAITCSWGLRELNSDLFLLSDSEQLSALKRTNNFFLTRPHTLLRAPPFSNANLLSPCDLLKAPLLRNLYSNLQRNTVSLQVAEELRGVTGYLGNLQRVLFCCAKRCTK